MRAETQGPGAMMLSRNQRGGTAVVDISQPLAGEGLRQVLARPAF